ncbi:MAG: tectonin domain-containing protein [Pyrinomonadaceae bacterium]
MTNASSSTNTRTMTFDSQLIEDFLHTDDILVDATSAAPLSVLLNHEGNSEALVISKNSRGNSELYHVCREPLSDSGWNSYGLGAYPCAIAVADSNTVWAVGTDQQLWQNQTGRWSQQVSLPGGATPLGVNERTNTYMPVSVGTDGAVWVVDGGGNLYQYDSNKDQWQPVAGPPHLTQAPVGSAGNLWAITGQDYGSQIMHQSGESWQTTQWPGETPAQVCVGADGSVWAIGQQGNLYEYVNQQWQQVAGAPSLSMIAVGAANNIWGLTGSGQSLLAVHYDGGKWETLPFRPATVTLWPAMPADITPQISVAIDGTVWSVDQNGVAWKWTGRGSSWQRQMMPTGMSGFTATGNVTEVVVGQDNEGPQAFYVEGGTLYQASLTADGTWLSVGKHTGAAGCSGLGVTNQLDTGALVVYGANGDGNMFVITKPSSSSYYNTATFNASGILKNAKLLINANNDNENNPEEGDGWFTAAVIGGRLCVQWGNADNPLNYGQQNNNLMIQVTQLTNGNNAPANLKEVIRLPWVESPAGFYCAVMDTGGNIYMVFNISVDVSNNGIGSFIPLTGNQAVISSPLAAVKSTGALIDASGRARIYATDANDKLWVVRQTGLSNDPNNPWTWTAWHPLGDDCLYLANGPGTHATHEFFTLDANSFLNHLWQDPVNLNWNAAQIRKPTGVLDDPYYVSQYVTEITVLDSGGNPEPNVPVTVSVTEPVSVWMNGVQYNLDSKHTTTFITNLMGKVALSTLALDLHTAQLTFHADGFASDYAVYPPQNIQNRLAAVDGPTLQNAQARTQSVPTEVNEPMVSSSYQSNCGTAATVIQNVFKVKSQNKINPGTPNGVSPNVSTPTYEAVRALWSAKVVDVQPLAPSTEGATEEPGSWDSFWHELADFGEDIWHGIRKGILAVEDIAVDVKKGVIKVTLALAEVGSAVIHFFIKTIDDVVHAVAAAFRWLGAEIEKAINWLKEFFSWGDILNTKTVIEHYINQVFGNLITDLKPDSPNNVQQLVQAQFDKLNDLISSAFSQAQTNFGANSFNGSVSHIPVDPKVGRHALQPDGVKSTYSANQVKSNYAHRKTASYIRQGGTVMPNGGGAGALALGSDPFDGFLSFVMKHLDLNNQNPKAPKGKYLKAQDAFQTKLQGLHNTEGFFDTAINDFLVMAKDFVLVVIEFVEEIIMALLNLAGDAVADFQKLLTHVLHIPVISWLYEEISKHPLTLMDLFCLIMAIPTTLLYKLIWGGANASPPFTTDQVKTITGQPIPWPQIQGTGLGMSSLPLETAFGAEQASALPVVLGILSLLNGILYSFVDLGTDTDALGPGEVDWSTFWSGMAVFLTTANLGYTVPYEVLEKQPNQRTTADILYVSLWGTGLMTIGLNVLSVVASKDKSLAKYLEVVGPVTVAVFGAVQLGLGIASAVEFSKANSGYNAAYSAASIITPIPSISKLLLLPKAPELMLILGPLDLICDIGSGGCSLIEAVS